MKRKLLFAIAFLGIGHLFAQPQYTIDITEKPKQLRANFLKMGTSTSPKGDVFSYNSQYLIKNGQPWFPVMGEFHYTRCPESEWETAILKMKAGGIQTISTYVFWIHHEETQGKYDWSGNKNLNKFLSLCQKHNMYVWLRVGPWSHGEARNGGFPDWLQYGNFGKRRDDPTYLKYVKTFFEQTYKQCDGQLFKQGGPIIGIQIENELQFQKQEVYQHMKTLKYLAIDAGFDVPYYSAFAQGSDDQDEFLFTMGGYPDSPWMWHTKKLYKTTFFIKPLENDKEIGADLLGQIDAKVRNTFPKLSAELGGGMQNTYHRRVVVSAKDIGGTAFTRIADGVNGMGYYMYHGGINPIGKTTMEEERWRSFPLPIINYDFQAPVGAMNNTVESFGELRLLNRFIKDFGADLCQQRPYFPKAMVRSHQSIDTVQSSIRLNNGSGFIFLSNYQRLLDLPSVPNFQLHLTSSTGNDNIPNQPIVFPKNSYAMWPYNFKLNEVILHYATVQPYCLLQNGKTTSYVFFSEESSEFQFALNGIKSIENITNCTINKYDKGYQVIIPKDSIALFSVTNQKGKAETILILPKNIALTANKITVANKELLVWGNAEIILVGDKLRVEKINKDPNVSLSIFPTAVVKGIANEKLIINKKQSESPISQYSILPNEKFEGNVQLKEDNSVVDMNEANRFQDSIIGVYTKSKKNFNLKQPGHYYLYQYHDLPNQHNYSLSFNAPIKGLVKDWFADIHYTGDVLAMYKSNNLLAYDQFNGDGVCKFRLGFVLGKNDNKLKAQVMPMPADYDIYVEDAYRKERLEKWTKAAIESVSLSPMYVYHLEVK